MSLTSAQEAGKTLKEWRNKRGFTQDEVAVRLEIQRPSYSNWESGATLPSEQAIERLRALGAPVEPWLKLREARSAQRSEDALKRYPRPSNEAPAEPGTARPIDALAEAERNLTRVTTWLADPSLTATQRTQLLNACRGCVKDLARLREGSPISEHPEFASLVEGLVTAVVEELGPNAPEGIEERIADRLNHLAQPGSPSARAA